MQTFMTPLEFKQSLDFVIGKDRLYKLLENKTIKSIRLGRNYLIPSDELKELKNRALAAK